MVCSVLRSGVATWEHQCVGPAPCLAHSGGSAHLSSAVRELLPSAVLTLTSPEFVPLPQALKVTGGISRSKVPLHACTSSPSSASSGPYSDHYFYTHFLEDRLNIQQKTQAHTFQCILFRAEKNNPRCLQPGISGAGQSQGPWPHPGSAAPLLRDLGRDIHMKGKHFTDATVCLLWTVL